MTVSGADDDGDLCGTADLGSRHDRVGEGSGAVVSVAGIEHHALAAA